MENGNFRPAEFSRPCKLPRMTNFLPTFHDPHNRGLDFEETVPLDGFVRFALFLRGFFELDLVYFEAEEGRLEVWVESEGVGGKNGFGFGEFKEGARWFA